MYSFQRIMYSNSKVHCAPVTFVLRALDKNTKCESAHQDLLVHLALDMHNVTEPFVELFASDAVLN